MIEEIYKEVDSKEKIINQNEQKKLLQSFTTTLPSDIKKILLVPPDYTRAHSGTGKLTSILYDLLKSRADIFVMPALGTHHPMTEDEITKMFGNNIPLDKFKDHDFINNTVHIGTIPKNYINKISKGDVNRSIDVKINKEITKNNYDLIISIGQVLPHGVVGMANYNKNILIGCGDKDMINVSHYIGAVYGMENLLGKDHSPVRKILDYAEEKFLKDINIIYVLTVNSVDINPETNLTDMLGLYIGSKRTTFEKAIKASQKYNIIKLKKPVKKMIVYMDKDEYKSTWLACKAIYRTRLVIGNGGTLLVLAPGLKEFGENKEIDSLIRKYGYKGKENIVNFVKKNNDLQNNLAAAAHLIHGSTEGRFKVIFATDQLSNEELKQVNHQHMSYEKAQSIYDINHLDYGYNKLINDEEVFYINNPSTGLWKII